MKAKYWGVVLSALFAIVSIGAGMIYSHKKSEWATHSDLSQFKKKEQTKVVDNKEEKMDTSIEEDINHLFLNNEKVYLSPKLSVDQIANVRTAVEKLPNGDEKEQFEKLLNEAGRKLAIQTTLNSFFEQPVLSGETVAESRTMKSTITQSQIDDLNNVVNEQSNGDGFYEKVKQILEQIHVSNPVTESEPGTETGTKSAEAEHAQALIDEIIVNGAVQSDFTMAQYENANAAVQGLPEGAEKAALMQEIKKIQEAMTNMGISYAE